MGHACKFYATKIKKKNEGLLTEINLLFENVRNLEKNILKFKFESSHSKMFNWGNMQMMISPS